MQFPNKNLFKITGVFTNGWPIFGLQKASFAQKTQVNLQEKASIFACVPHMSLHELQKFADEFSCEACGKENMRIGVSIIYVYGVSLCAV